MERDIRSSRLYREIEALHTRLRGPGTGQISDATEMHASPDGKWAVFAGTIMDALEGRPATRICLTNLTTGDTRVLTFGPRVDRMPKFSPDGRQVAYLSDRQRGGDFQLFILDPLTGASHPAPRVEGWIEYLHWSPDGARILLGVAGHGADTSVSQGSITSSRAHEDIPPWMPVVARRDEDFRWRRLWVYETATRQVRAFGPPECNVWEAAWCGNGAVAAIASPGPSEGLWYTARLHVIELDTGAAREVYRPRDQIGLPAASPAGKQIAVVDALCSDRGIVAGDLRLVDLSSGRAVEVDTAGVDISHVEWQSGHLLLLAGHRGLESVVALFDTQTSTFTEVWCSCELTSGGRYISVCGLNDAGDFVLARWSTPALHLLSLGYAIFLPNPRGSSGRGREFARRVYGDMGGGDAGDLLSGLDELVRRGVADPKRRGRARRLGGG